MTQVDLYYAWLPLGETGAVRRSGGAAEPGSLKTG